MKITLLKPPFWDFFEKLYRETDGVQLDESTYNLLMFLTIAFFLTILFLSWLLFTSICNAIDKSGIKPIQLSGKVIDKKTNDDLYLVVQVSVGIYRMRVNVSTFFMYEIGDEISFNFKVSRFTKKVFDITVVNPLPKFLK